MVRDALLLPLLLLSTRPRGSGGIRCSVTVCSDDGVPLLGERCLFPGDDRTEERDCDEFGAAVAVAVERMKTAPLVPPRASKNTSIESDQRPLVEAYRRRTATFPGSVDDSLAYEERVKRWVADRRTHIYGANGMHRF